MVDGNPIIDVEWDELISQTFERPITALRTEDGALTAVLDDGTQITVRLHPDLMADRADEPVIVTG